MTNTEAGEYHACGECGWIHGDIDALIASLPGCAECGESEEGKCYRLRDETWALIAKPDDVLHPWCVEKRLGRPLVLADMSEDSVDPFMAWALAR